VGGGMADLYKAIEYRSAILVEDAMLETTERIREKLIETA
jgi:hypothetical protein